MSSNSLSIRLLGQLPTRGELDRWLGTAPSEYVAQGTPLGRRRRRVQAFDLWLLDLAEWDGENADPELMQSVAMRLAQLAPALAGLDRTSMEAQLLIGVTQFEEWGGCKLPEAILSAAAAAKLSLLIMVGLYLDLPEEETDSPSDRAVQ
jgi:hypothetical protein